MHPSSSESVAWVDALDDAYPGVAWVDAVDDAYRGVGLVHGRDSFFDLFGASGSGSKTHVC